MKEALKEKGFSMKLIEEAPPTPVKEPEKSKLTVIQEARIWARGELGRKEGIGRPGRRLQ